MKKIFICIFITLLLATSNSCSDDFLDRFPTEDVPSAAATTTTGNLFLVINGIHRSLYQRYNSQGEGGIGSMMIQADVLGEDFVMTSAGNGWFNNAYKWVDHTNASDNDALFPYRVLYRIIRNANVVINGAENAEGPILDRNAALGQALVYRAFAHFQLVQLYGKRYVGGTINAQLGVPIRLTADNEPLARATVEEVYTQVNQDLQDAIDLLSEYERPNKSHFDVSVAVGLKARVALVQQNYTLAASLAKQARQGYSLMSNDEYYSSFNTYTNREWMWGSFVQEDQTIFFANFGAYVSRNFSSTNIRTNPKAISSKLYNQITPTDIRSKLFDPTGAHDSLPSGVSLLSSFRKFPYTNQKFIAAGTGDSRMDVPYMRASEMYLIEAEALSYSDEGAARQVLLALASNRDPDYTLSTNTGQALKNEIYTQRRIELWGEGFRFFDLKRLNQPLDRRDSNHDSALVGQLFQVPAGDPRWEWQIPLDEINSNPLVEQNPS
ncbi:RagB/SusD family nutrient uptake outer membrane protein [Leeuwenhoekiella marinoflava]|uniref:SusD-like starch-binding protein associating with outer membrane n=2 Tax=Leeuwenhoekiella marinoflava TaxID=988 RepID=A0A4Q0P7V6_9FLAO|nr:RagB/SusD family nutrient uptake outer membrane protein [Leeuwenhoekiella marinoflava]RXG22378.1 SusD-like starch-binding protein associating with outer membrane [Leeuwenhoekiella marinoflava]SHF32073.1 SusD family protein [Leeuwenhoekiella marinoflava DSM 3653]